MCQPSKALSLHNFWGTSGYICTFIVQTRELERMAPGMEKRLGSGHISRSLPPSNPWMPGSEERPLMCPHWGAKGKRSMRFSPSQPACPQSSHCCFLASHPPILLAFSPPCPGSAPESRTESGFHRRSCLRTDTWDTRGLLGPHSISRHSPFLVTH